MDKRTYLIETNGELKLISKKNKQPKIVSQNGDHVHINEITYEKDVLEFVDTHVKKRNIKTEEKAKWFKYIEKVDKAINRVFSIAIIGSMFRTICNFLIKATFPAAIIIYMIMMSMSFGNTYESTGMGFYMGVLSITIAVVYSQYVDNWINKKIPSHYKLYAFETKDLILFTIAVGASLAICIICMLIKIDVSGNVGNLLTWISLGVCFTDKIICKYK